MDSISILIKAILEKSSKQQLEQELKQIENKLKPVNIEVTTNSESQIKLYNSLQKIYKEEEKQRLVQEKYSEKALSDKEKILQYEQKVRKAIEDSNLKEQQKTKELQEQITLFQKRMQLESGRISGKYDSLVDKNSLNNLQNEISGLSLSTPNVTNKMKELSLGMKEVELNAKNSSSAIKNTKQDSISFAEDLRRSAFKFTEWYLLAGGITSVIDSIKNAVSYISQLDNSLNEIRIVTGQSQEEVQKLATSYNNLAKEMSVTTAEISSEAANLFRQGLDTSQVEERMKSIIQYAKISSISIADSDKIITATANATGESVNKIIDIFALLGDKTASGADEIGEALQRVASAAENSGISIEKSASWIATISSITRESASTIGRSINSIISRYESIKSKGFNSEDTTKLNDVVKALSQIGITATDSLGQLRPFADIMDEVGAKFSTLSKNEQAYITTAMFGTFQRNKGLTLLQNYNTSLQNYETALNSAGTAEQKFNIYQDSTQAKLDKLTATIEGKWQGAVSSNFTKGFIDNLTKLIDTFGNLNTIISLTSTAFLLWKGKALTDFFTSLPLKIRTSVTSMQLFKDVSTAIQLQQAGEITTNQALSLSFNSLGVAAKGAGASILTAFATNPLGWIAIAITGIISVMDIMNQKAQESQQKMEKLNQEISSLKDQQKQFEDLSKEYETLSSKVSLSADEHKRLLEVQNDIAGISKDLVLGYDAEGNAILKGTDAINAQADAYKRMLALKLQDRDSLLEDSFNSSRKSVSNAKKSMQSAGEQDLLPYDNTTNKDWENLRRAEDIGKSYLDSMSNNDFKNAQKNLAELQKLSGLMAQEAVKVQNARQQIKVALDQATQATPEFLQLPDTIQKIVLEYNNTLTKSVESGELTYKGFKQQQLDLVNILSSNDIKQAFEKYQTEQQNLLQGKSNEANVKKAKDAYINEIKQSAPNFTKLTDEISKLLIINPDVVNKNKETLDNAFPKEIKSFEDMTKEVKGVVTSVKELNDIQADLSKGNKLTADSVIDLITQYPELIDYIHQTANGYTVEAQGMNIVRDALINKQMVALETESGITEVMKSALEARLNIYGIELESIKTLNDARNAAYKMNMTTDTQPDLSSLKQFASDVNILGNIAKLNTLKGLLTSGLKTGVKTTKPKAEPSSKAGVDIDNTLVQKDRYYELNQELAKYNSLLDGQKSSYDVQFNKDKIINLQKQIELNSKLKQITHEKTDEERKEREEVVKSLKEKGVKFSGTGDNITDNGTGTKVLTSMVNQINALAKVTTSKSSKEQIQNLNDLKAKYKDLKEQLDRFFDIQNKEIPELRNKWNDYTKAANDAKNKILDVKFDIAVEGANSLSNSLKDIQNNLKGISDENIQGKFDLYHKEVAKATVLVKYWKSQEDKFKDSPEMLQKVIDKVQDYESIVQSTTKDITDLMKKQVDTSAKGFENLMKNEANLHKKKMDNLKAEKKAFDDYIDDQKKQLQEKWDLEDYNKDVNSQSKDINETQAEINKYSMAVASGDMEAISKVAELQKTLADQKSKLDDIQSKRTRSLQTKALDDAKDNLDKEIQNQKDAEDKRYQLITDTYDKLKADIDTFVQAGINANLTMIDSITSDFNNLKTQFDSTTSDMGTIFQNNFISKLEEAKKQLNLLSSGDTTAFIIDQMKTNSSQYGSASPVEKQRLSNDNLQMGNAIGWTRDSHGVWYDQYGNNAYNTYPVSKSKTIQQIKSNASQYGTASDAKKKELSEKNLKLGQLIGWTRDSSGNWHDETGGKVDLSKFATGTDDVKQISMVGENGAELRVLNPNGKDSIIPHGITENLVSFGNNPIDFISRFMPQINTPQITPIASGIGGINVHFNSLLSVGNLNNIDENKLSQMTLKASDLAASNIKKQLFRFGQR